MKIDTVPAKLESMLAIIDTARRGLEQILASGVDIDRSLIDSISKLSSAHANLSREAMRWAEKLKKQASTSSLQERKAGVIGFITALPLGERQSLYEALVDHEANTAANVPLRIGQ